MAGQPIILPCLLPGTICTYTTSLLESSALSLELDLALVQVPFPLEVNIPTLRLEVTCCEHETVLLIDLHTLAFSTEAKSVSVGLLLTPVGLDTLQHAIMTITNGKEDVRFRVSGAEEYNLLSSLLSGLEEVVLVEKGEEPEEGTVEGEPGFELEEVGDGPTCERHDEELGRHANNDVFEVLGDRCEIGEAQGEAHAEHDDAEAGCDVGFEPGPGSGLELRPAATENDPQGECVGEDGEQVFHLGDPPGRVRPGSSSGFADAFFCVFQ